MYSEVHAAQAWGSPTVVILPTHSSEDQHEQGWECCLLVPTQQAFKQSLIRKVQNKSASCFQFEVMNFLLKIKTLAYIKS